MTESRLPKCLLLLPLLVLFAAGCATTGPSEGGADIHHFKPVPQAAVRATELPGDMRPGLELLREAENSYQLAEAARNAGDAAAAQRHYLRVVNLLREANLDPTRFASATVDFEKLLAAEGGAGGRDRAPKVNFNQNLAASRTAQDRVKIPFPLPQEVYYEIDRIQNGYPGPFQSALDRSGKYQAELRRRIAAAGLPEELVYVAMIESHYTPKIVSRAGAGGMWQFMRTTGLRYGMRIDNEIDERYNWERSTQAAIDYLSHLHEYFNGDWTLAISAYNMGEGGLERAIAANGGETDFWTLIKTPPAADRIKDETKRYFPKFVAYWIVASSPERFGFTAPSQGPEPTERIFVEGLYALDDLDRALSLPSGTLARLNPELLRETTPVIGGYAIAVPAGQGETLLAALPGVPTLKHARARHSEFASAGEEVTYRVKRGDTLAGIAKKYGTSPEALQKRNKLRTASSLKSGQTLRIPTGATGGGAAEPAPVQTARETAKAQPDAPVAATYIVKPGDTLSKIASSHGMTVAALQRENKLGDATSIRPGQKLRVSGFASTAREKAADFENIRHRVQSGDTLGKIAQKYDVALQDLLAWNNLKQDTMLKIGQEIAIRRGQPPASTADTATAKAPAPKATTATHTVAQGDTAGKIAEKYGVSTASLLAHNNLSAKSVLKVGQQLKIPAGGGSAAAQAADAGQRITHTVASGHNPTVIAQRYGVRVNDLYQWNNWDKNHVLMPGEKVIVYKK
jgi:membrane-bound lytic murein transglycosylase D